ncbi:hypothetical protein MKX01_023287 [Papaver californicum]|nr:hypothetical protein MKX01_023287 [Papaver californicum]
MAMRMLGRSVSRRFSGGGKILSEEEKAAENIYIKKIEKEKLEKLVHKGSKPEEQLASSTGTGAAESLTDAKPSVDSNSSTTSICCRWHFMHCYGLVFEWKRVETATSPRVRLSWYRTEERIKVLLSLVTLI